MITEYLQKLGLSDKEIALYLAILQRGKVDIPEVAKITGINRTTVYSVASELVSKGLISQDLGSRPNMLIAQDPEQLKTYVNRQRNIVDSLIPELHTISKNTEYSVPKIKFVSELDLRVIFIPKRIGGTRAWQKQTQRFGACRILLSLPATRSGSNGITPDLIPKISKLRSLLIQKRKECLSYHKEKLCISAINSILIQQSGSGAII